MSELVTTLKQLTSGRTQWKRAEAEARSAANDLRTTLKLRKPPVDLACCARSRLISRIDQLDIIEDGILYGLGETNYGVELNKSSIESRQQFTLAHEVGHTYFVDRSAKDWDRSFRLIDSKIGSTPDESTKSPEERLCNVFASELLIPSEIVEDLIFTHGLSWRSIFELSKVTRASITSCAIRALETGLRNGVLICWKSAIGDNADQRLSIAWHVSSPGLGSSLDQSFVANQGTQPCEAMEHGPGRIHTGSMYLRFLPQGGDRYYTESVCLSRRSGSILSLILFDRRDETSGSDSEYWSRRKHTAQDDQQLKLFET